MIQRVSRFAVVPVGLRLAALMLVCAAGLAGCGRKGPLELPPDVPQTPASQAADEARQLDKPRPIVDDPGVIQPPNKSYQIPAAQQLQQATQNPPQRAINVPAPQTGKPFVLDPLL